MPKGKIEVVKGGRRTMISIQRKFKIGGRKSVRSALTMSTEDLRKTVNSGRARDKQTAKNELTRRGEAFELEAVEAEAAEAA